MAELFSVTRGDVIDYAELVVRDYLQAKGYLAALEALTEDVSAAKAERRRKNLSESSGANVEENAPDAESDADASVRAWYIVNQHVGLPTLLNENRVESTKQFDAVLEVLVDNMVLQPSIKHTPQATPWQAQPSVPEFTFPLARSRSNNQTAQSPKQFDDFSFFEERPQTSDSHHPSATKSRALAKTNPLFATGKTAPRAQTASTVQRQFKSKNAANQIKNSVENWIPEEIRQRMVRDLLVLFLFCFAAAAC